MPTVTNNRAKLFDLNLYENNYRGIALRYNDLVSLAGYSFVINFVYGNQVVGSYTIDGATDSNEFMGKVDNTLVITKILDDIFPKVIDKGSRTLQVISTDPGTYEYTDYVITVKGIKY